MRYLVLAFLALMLASCGPPHETPANAHRNLPTVTTARAVTRADVKRALPAQTTQTKTVVETKIVYKNTRRKRPKPIINDIHHSGKIVVINLLAVESEGGHWTETRLPSASFLNKQCPEGFVSGFPVSEAAHANDSNPMTDKVVLICK